MTAQKGFVPILVILGVVIIAIVGAGGAAVIGQAPRCPNQGSVAGNEKEIGDLLEKSGSVTVSDGQATTIARKYLGDKVQDPRVCFTSGFAQASGNIKLGPVSPSFYASAGIDLSGASPKATNLDIKVGALPSMPFVSAQVEKIVSDIINENLAKVTLKKKYSTQFSRGSVTVTKLSK
ncbi:hypothetical protein A2697_04030 [Candidatus Curtissbacteria bacterium RIFCSPHIGHO2_01_FULL_41_44]|uniref:Uncharacterized protein n=1 Tax=Candidatus Curtissbacteria bacterium RIFCSPLOWO2_01_FULL_42_50 TaxID=1797730 RepID=A0A1F5H348_9BACT|nr:MAG: hypothetical protein A2697_04030 [Candidatus Curtissbacteria bacterium RIFCSPHIGHO2_01_FULL_41_44]OGD92902.1 MAG: hypothetical protein A3C33_02230 [Candidatus Curtissbacteria bacterium RIFCSPHIGHO2_02_FULL_42_58]OGD96635.1 MAG: hypothetical protein A3E71_00725 [Candidatus Curtissbacteria bacterium RIFCSPHIGHO2_12_FULL_42_33]OGD98521.1 MAG: hypothetical protein A3B54_00265 [Candidatus Curtissbacteria bacterium RIFCSPLOWO2_01_FULL_42_50]OGE02883.1 MAG: hypothetical protein A3G16_04315 [Ca